MLAFLHCCLAGSSTIASQISSTSSHQPLPQTTKKDINLAGKRDLVIDVSLVHDFTENSRRDDYRRNGQLRYDDPDLLLHNAANAEVQEYREDYSIRPRTSTKLRMRSSHCLTHARGSSHCKAPPPSPLVCAA